MTCEDTDPERAAGSQEAEIRMMCLQAKEPPETEKEATKKSSLEPLKRA